MARSSRLPYRFMHVHNVRTPLVGEDLIPYTAADSSAVKVYMLVSSGIMDGRLNSKEFRTLVNASTAYDNVRFNLVLLTAEGISVDCPPGDIIVTIGERSDSIRFDCQWFNLRMPCTFRNETYMHMLQDIFTVSCVLHRRLRFVPDAPWRAGDIAKAANFNRAISLVMLHKGVSF